MAFSSVIFLFFFLPVFFLVYYLSPQKIKNPVILLASIFFYSWGGPLFVFVILGTTLLDFFLVRAMYHSEKNKLIYLIISLSVNVGLLFYFKYFNFFIDNLNSVISLSGGEKIFIEKIILPIGISFYTFESITYIIDVYRKEHKPLDNFWDYQLYIMLFPKLIAGPIVRYHQIADQITGRFKNDNIQNRLSGLMRFIIGLSKKVLLANVFGEVADHIYDELTVDQQTTFYLWIASFAYTLQIYFDFSGYSDMALGLCMMMGFRLPENFNFPYISGSITEFWRRWHISLGAWMKNYLYIPLGGNKITKLISYRNLVIVFLLSGLWHGASWNFILWGAFHGFFLVVERLFLLRYLEKIPKLISALMILFVVNLGWVLFRIEDLEALKLILTKMFSFYTHDVGEFALHFKFIFLALLGLLISLSGLIPAWYRATQEPISMYTKNNTRTICLSVICLLLCLISLSNVVASDFNPFIYFRF